jgi:dihydroorotate dehydrogenase (fumarate)
MENLVTNYLGISLKSPLIVSSSRLTSTIAALKEAEKSGAGAVVLKSLFEEQILHHINSMSGELQYPEAEDYISYYIKSHTVDDYLRLIENAKKTLKIPVIPSINCFSSRGWMDYAKNIADAGADAIEINVFFLPSDRKTSSADAERIYFNLIEKLTATISIPISIKIGARFSNILYMIDQFYMRGAKGVVMFNRFYEPEIDVEKMEIIPASIFSSREEIRYVLRWVAMASAQKINIDISASTGVQSGEDVIKYLLAGAQTVQVCSSLYRNGISYLKTMNEQISNWMAEKNFKNIEEFRGKLNWKNYSNPEVFERTQFMKYFSSVD